MFSNGAWGALGLVLLIGVAVLVLAVTFGPWLALIVTAKLFGWDLVLAHVVGVVWAGLMILIGALEWNRR